MFFFKHHMFFVLKLACKKPERLLGDFLDLREETTAQAAHVFVTSGQIWIQWSSVSAQNSSLTRRWLPFKVPMGTASRTGAEVLNHLSKASIHVH